MIPRYQAYATFDPHLNDPIKTFAIIIEAFFFYSDFSFDPFPCWINLQHAFYSDKQPCWILNSRLVTLYDICNVILLWGYDVMHIKRNIPLVDITGGFLPNDIFLLYVCACRIKLQQNIHRAEKSVCHVAAWNTSYTVRAAKDIFSSLTFLRPQTWTPNASW